MFNFRRAQLSYAGGGAGSCGSAGKASGSSSSGSLDAGDNKLRRIYSGLRIFIIIFLKATPNCNSVTIDIEGRKVSRN